MVVFVKIHLFFSTFVLAVKELPSCPGQCPARGNARFPDATPKLQHAITLSI
jgi:hypothetical protein